MPRTAFRRLSAAMLVCLLSSAACSSPAPLRAERDLLRGVDPDLAGPMVTVVIEIPSGTNAKWEIRKDEGRLEWETRDGVPRVVNYLSYPGNYGMVPRTLLPEEFGGDGDPLDVLVLGPATERAAVLRVRLLGVLKLLDDGEQDDKLIAVSESGPLSDVADLDDLERRYAGVTRIVEIWFSNYKGPGRLETRGFGDQDEAIEILETAIVAFRSAVEGANQAR